MRFFSAIHRSITDPQFYTEIVGYSRKQVAGFLVKLLLLMAFVCTIAQFYYLVDSERGIPKQIEAAFGRMEIHNGILDPKVQTPYVPPTYQIIPIFEKLAGFQSYFSSDNDSMLVVDTSATRNYVLKVPAIVMAKDKVIFILNKKNSIEVPYKGVLFGTENLLFNAGAIKQFLYKNYFMITLSIFISTFLQNSITVLFSIFFLAVAAFFFRLEKVSLFSQFLRAAMFAITPMVIGLMLVAISGVKILWGWHLMIFISTIVLFRGVVAIGKTVAPDDSGENKV